MSRKSTKAMILRKNLLLLVKLRCVTRPFSNNLGSILPQWERLFTKWKAFRKVVSLLSSGCSGKFYKNHVTFRETAKNLTCMSHGTGKASLFVLHVSLKETK